MTALIRSGRLRWAPPVMAAALLAAAPVAMADQFWLGILTFAVIYFVAGNGLVVLLGLARQISFGQGVFFGIGAYVSALLSVKAHVPVPAAMAAACAAGAAIGYLVGRPILRLRGLSLAMGTLALAVIGFVLFTQLPVTGGPVGLTAIPGAFRLGPLAVDAPASYYWFALAVAIVVTLLTRGIVSSHAGRALRALGDSPRAAAVAGVDVAGLKARAFTYAAALAALAGALYAHYLTFLSSDAFNVDLSVLLVIMVSVGGASSLLGTALGTLFVTVLNQYLSGLPGYSQLIYGVLLALIFLFLPGGLVGGLRTAAAAARHLMARGREP